MGTHKNDEIIKELYQKFGLTSEDIFTKEKKGTNIVIYRIITRKGIDKIEAKSDAKLEWKYAFYSEKCVGIEIWARKYDPETGDLIAEFHTNGEADDQNIQIPGAKYYAAQALARAKSRALLGIEGFYKYGFYSEDEADEFKKEVSESRRSEIKTGIKIPSNLEGNFKKY